MSLPKKSIKQIIKDVVMGLNEEKERDIRKDYFDYDRSDFIKSILKRDGINMDEAYSTSIQTIVTEVIQISNEGYITYYDDEGNNLKQHYRIEEK